MGFVGVGRYIGFNTCDVLGSGAALTELHYRFQYSHLG